MGLKYVTVKQIQKLDNIAIKKYGVPSIALMENAGRSISDEVLKQLKRKKTPKVAVVCGVEDFFLVGTGPYQPAGSYFSKILAVGMIFYFFQVSSQLIDIFGFSYLDKPRGITQLLKPGGGLDMGPAETERSHVASAP